MPLLLDTSVAVELLDQVQRAINRVTLVDGLFLWMIAATAMSQGLILATLNPRDFRNIPGLLIEDWSTE